MNRTIFSALLGVSVALMGAPYEARASETERGAWAIYLEEANGDLHFYDPARLEQEGVLRRVWYGVRFKNSVMGAASFRSLLEIDCAARTERVLQSTFFTDREWQRPAMKTDTKPKPQRKIVEGSEKDSLARVVCDRI